MLKNFILKLKGISLVPSKFGAVVWKCRLSAGVAPAMHVASFVDQSFQGLKSKEVRDAGSPPKEFRAGAPPPLSNADCLPMVSTLTTNRAY